MKKRLLIFVVTYNAERTIETVLNRIPAGLYAHPTLSTEILVIDDCSPDGTFSKGYDLKEGFVACPLTILKNPKNLGYGGNQKLGYKFAIDQGFDYVALLHGDGQYAPEELPKLVSPLIAGEADAVFGSRMLKPGGAIRGGMPFYKFIGNKILTRLENILVGTKLSEYHSGYRLYSTAALKRIPFGRNSDYFDFDTDIIIQLHASGARIAELPIPTFYGDEICHVNGVRYGLKILWSCLRYRIQQFGILYDPKFDTESENNHYKSKFGFISSHSLAIAAVKPTDRLLLLGSGPRELVEPFKNSSAEVYAIDQYVNAELKSVCDWSIEADLDQFDFKSLPETTFDAILALDVIEHLRSPEKFLEDIRSASSCRNSRVILTTPNIAFLPIRLMLLLGGFNYGKRGILDRTHTRLFTVASLTRILQQAGFDILSQRGIPAPFPLAFGDNALGRLLLKLNDWACRVLPSFFSYQLFVVCTPKPTVEQLLKSAFHNTEQELLRREERSAA